MSKGVYKKNLDYGHPANELLREKAGAYLAAIVKRDCAPGLHSGDARRELYAAAITFAVASGYRKVPKRSKKQRDDREFKRGYALALAGMIRQGHLGDARDVMNQDAFKPDFWRGLGIAEFDTRQLKKLLTKPHKENV